MALEGVTRRLAAILCSDVVGYSRLMAVDEVATLATLNAHMGIVANLIAMHHGRVFGGAGDSVVAEFSSAVDAVTCAAEIQRAIGERNDELAAEQRMQLRIGVNLGDVMVQDDNLFGDGVNVAARLESLSAAGGICVSGAIYEQVKNKVGIDFDDLGDQTVKNLAEPIRAYQFLPPAGPEGAVDAPPSIATDRRAANGNADRLSIVVLPFNNLSNDAEQEYFSDGITEDITTDLSKISGLFVVARNSAFAYKGKAVNVPRISRALGVRYVLEGSVRKANNRLRITAQLIDGETGGHVWADRFDRDLTDIFALQDAVTSDIVAALKITLSSDEKQRLAGKVTQHIEAYDYYLRAQELMWRFTREDTAAARGLYTKVAALDPDCAAAVARIGYTYVVDYVNAWEGSAPETLQRGIEYAERALEIDPDEFNAHWTLSIARLWQRDFDAAMREIDAALRLAPNSAEAHAVKGNVLVYSERPEEALLAFEEAGRRDPSNSDIGLYFMAHAHFLCHRYQQAADFLKRRLIRNPDTDITHVLLASAYGHLGRHDEARAEWQATFEYNPDYSLAQKQATLPYKNPADLQRIIDGLLAAGIEV